jgi:hypothetical protein
MVAPPLPILTVGLALVAMVAPPLPILTVGLALVAMVALVVEGVRRVL